MPAVQSNPTALCLILLFGWIEIIFDRSFNGGIDYGNNYAEGGEVDRKWYVLDAAGKPLGRVAAKAAHLLRGKHKPHSHRTLTAVIT